MHPVTMHGKNVSHLEIRMIRINLTLRELSSMHALACLELDVAPELRRQLALPGRGLGGT
jgi:hypothetical protein